MSRPVAANLRPVEKHSSADLHPRVPTTMEQAGLSQDLITQLILKMLHFGAEQTGSELGRKLGLEFSVIEPALEFLKRSHQCEVFGGVVGGPTFTYRITDAGRRRALLFLEQSQYFGVAPVPLAQYRAYMEAYRAGMV